MYADPNPENAVVAWVQPQEPINSGFYPKPEVDYQTLMQNPDLFLQKLQSFHSSFRTKFKLPTLGGKRLDLHRLFMEVTSRGGVEKVVRDRRWKEVTRAFRFPSSNTSASFVLRKYYLSLLYHFEQVYYFQKEAPSGSVPDITNTPINASASMPVNVNASSSQQPLVNHTSTGQYLDSKRVGPGSSVTGTIDAKFDYGYLVTVTMGNEKLNGVLYHSSSQMQTSQRSIVMPVNSFIERRKRRLGRKDPSRPKRNRSGYNFFFSENYNTLKPSYHGQERALTRKLGIMWNRLTDAEKKVYQEKGKRDKERHEMEMLEYNASHIPHNL